MICVTFSGFEHISRGGRALRRWAVEASLLCRVLLYWWMRSRRVSLVDCSILLPMLLRLDWLLLARAGPCASRRLTSATFGVPPSSSCAAPSVTL